MKLYAKGGIVMGMKKAKGKKSKSKVGKALGKVGKAIGIGGSSGGRKRRTTVTGLQNKILIFKLKKKLNKLKFGGR